VTKPFLIPMVMAFESIIIYRANAPASSPVPWFLDPPLLHVKIPVWERIVGAPSSSWLA